MLPMLPTWRLSVWLFVLGGTVLLAQRPATRLRCTGASDMNGWGYKYQPASKEMPERCSGEVSAPAGDSALLEIYSAYVVLEPQDDPFRQLWISPPRGLPPELKANDATLEVVFPGLLGKDRADSDEDLELRWRGRYETRSRGLDLNKYRLMAWGLPGTEEGEYIRDAYTSVDPQFLGVRLKVNHSGHLDPRRDDERLVTRTVLVASRVSTANVRETAGESFLQTKLRPFAPIEDLSICLVPRRADDDLQDMSDDEDFEHCLQAPGALTELRPLVRAGDLLSPA